MKFFPFSKYPHLNEVFDHGYCDDGSHVKDEVFACHFPAKGVLAEETSKGVAVVHDNGDSRFRPSYRIRNWGEKVCMAVAKAKKEREKASYMYDLSMGRKERHKLAYPDQVYPPHVAEKRRRALEASRMGKESKFPSPAVENISESLTLQSSRWPCASNTSRSAATPVKQHPD